MNPAHSAKSAVQSLEGNRLLLLWDAAYFALFPSDGNLLKQQEINSPPRIGHNREGVVEVECTTKFFFSLNV